MNLRCLTAVAMTALFAANGAVAQDCFSGNSGATCNTGHCVPTASPWSNAVDTAARNPDGSLVANCVQGPRGRTRPYPSPGAAAYYAARDQFSPAPLYAYSRHGIDATRTHTWNYNQSAQYSWHGNYYHRQYGQPLALVVPPTAAFQTEYSWGVGQTKSLPIYHQFQRPYAENPEQGNFAPTPYWPSSTRQFGVYPVRGSW